MMKKIKYFSASDFKSYMKSLGFIGVYFNRNVVSKEFIESQSFAIISIGNIEWDEGYTDDSLYLNGCNNHWMPDTNNILNINFNDVGEKEEGALTELQAQEILCFIEDNQYKKDWFIHCSAGISRSGAVASIVYDYFKSKDIPVKIEPEYPKTPNYYVRNILNNEQYF